MDATQVIEKILSDARSEAEKIKRQAAEKESAEQKQFDEQLDKYEKQTKILAEKAGDEKKAHILAGARMEISKGYLAEKRKILDEVFVKAQTQLENLPDKDYRDFCTRLMLKAVETGDEEVIIDNNEKRIDQEFINQINQKLSQSRQGNLKLSSERQDIGAGFILRRGKIKTNVSIPVLFAQVRKELEIELAKELFKK